MPAGHLDPQPAAPVNFEAEPGVPAGHAVQIEAPALAAIIFAGQALHEVLPGATAMVPGLQGVQREPAPVEKVPTGHCLQAVPSTEKKPGLQAVQAVSPVFVASKPGKHRRQFLLPLALWKNPTLHGRHAPIPELEYDPGGQAEHIVEPTVSA